MILGIGCDIVKVSRFVKDGEFITRFIKKNMTKKEQEEIGKKDKNKEVQEVATRFSAKEAVSKALGTGFQNGITLKDIEIIHNELGCPQVTLYRKALERANLMAENKEFNLHVSLSNEKEYATAFAVIETK